ncbi:MAG: hypothetical protein WCS20_13325, partial [Alphaproteobacteria bacterium]
MNEEKLLRLIWNPRDFDAKTGRLKVSAFAQGDLIPHLDIHGERRYISMDVLGLISKVAVDWNIAGAQAAGKGAEKERRHEAKFLEFAYGDLVGLLLESGQYAFRVMDAPLQAGDNGPGSPENLAHVGVQSTTPDPVDETLRNEKVAELRNLL